MKVLHINTFDTGGAAKSCLRLHQGLLEQNIDSKVMVLYKYSHLEQVYDFLPDYQQTLFKRIEGSFLYRRNKVIKSLKNKIYPGKVQSSPHTIYNILKHPLTQQADIIHLHWVARFLDYDSFFSVVNKPVVWTLHDMNPILGGYHYETDMLGMRPYDELEEVKNIKIKKKALQKVSNVSVVSPSYWLYQKSLQSALLGNFSNYYIPYGVDTNKFKPADKKKAREYFSLPQENKILLFIADSLTDPRKGYSYLVEALKQIDLRDTLLCTIGKGNIPPVDFPLKHLGYIASENELSLAFAAADIFITTSIEDNLPNTVLESLACGTPVVGFRIGGIPDMVIEGETGLLASPKNISELAERMQWLLKNAKERNEMGKKGRKLVEEKFTISTQADQYRNLYNLITVHK
ncbi:glycosyltransferase [Rhodocytophaga rosea]|uniref:Glycosyltransferase n=1 Tax=Rhodocytophaga rosea TaxID=2704465 RepID=A0A6C0GR30_9BACT|nr:glycosyltransferase [Rhodocytophaga rosea]QHT70545.1 glycosyltransferase [Rhodocytophaga rosea]